MSSDDKPLPDHTTQEDGWEDKVDKVVGYEDDAKADDEEADDEQGGIDIEGTLYLTVFKADEQRGKDDDE